jgi:arabinogalactan endo-1,4-beta-galactosidase
LSLGLGMMPKAAHAQEGAPQAVDATQQLFLPALTDNSCSGLRDTASVFGIQKYGDTSRGQPNFPYLQGTSATWLRLTLYKSQVVINPDEPFNYNFRQADKIFAAARDACVNVIATIEWKPFWNDGFQILPFGATKHAEFAQMMKAIVERYDGDGIDDEPTGIVVNYFEMYNEPDFDIRWGNRGADYAAMLKATYPAIKEANPDAKIVIGGLAYDGFTDKKGRFVRSFLEDVLKAGGGAYFYIMNIHYYPSFRADWTDTKSTGLPEKLVFLRALLAKYNHQKDFFITETSWVSNSLDGIPSSEDQQGRFLVQLFTQAVALNIDSMTWWLLQDSVTNGELDPRQSGLITGLPPIRPKQAYYVYRNAVKWLGNAAYVGVGSQVTASNDLEAYLFRNRLTDKRFYVAWLNPIATNTTQPFSFPANKATVYNKDGNAISTHTDAGDGKSDGKISVPVGGSPVYILIN